MLNLQVMGVRVVRAKPVTVHAVEIHLGNVDALAKWITEAGGATRFCTDGLYIHTVNGWILGNWGDVLIKGTEAEFYPITKQVYLNKYEDVTQSG
jgi:hypothetical protein